MSYTFPTGQPQGLPHSICNFLREAMIAEIIAINGYDNGINTVDNYELKKLFYDIRKDEKKHYGLFLQALRAYDPIEFKQYMNAPTMVHVPNKPLKARYNKGSSNTTHILDNIRDQIKGELEAVLLYEDLITKTKDRKIQDLLTIVSTDEKEHTENLTLALIRLDKNKYGPLEQFMCKC